MVLFPISTDQDPVVRKKAEEVSLPLDEKTDQILHDMVLYLKESQDEEFSKSHHIRPGVGIAAPQIGISKRFFAVYLDAGEKHYEYALVNPRIVSSSVKKAYLEAGEGCLSVPVDHKGHVYRYFRVTIDAYDALSKKNVRLKLQGYPAIVFQHEYDHLDGVLYYDRIDPKDPFYEDPDAVAIA